MLCGPLDDLPSLEGLFGSLVLASCNIHEATTEISGLKVLELNFEKRHFQPLQDFSLHLLTLRFRNLEKMHLCSVKSQTVMGIGSLFNLKKLQT